MKNLERISRIAAELENQLGIVEKIDDEADEAAETEAIPEPALEAGDEDVTVALEDGGEQEVISDVCPECGKEPCECEAGDDEISVEEMADISERIGKVAMKVRASKSLTASQKEKVLARLARFAKKSEKVAGEEAEDPKFLQIVSALKSFGSNFTKFKSKKIDKLLGIKSGSSVTFEELMDALYNFVNSAK